MDGGTGADQMYAGNGHTVMNGGRDDDLMVGSDRTTFYTGHGKNKVWSAGPDDLIYGNASDTIKKDPGATLNLVPPARQVNKASPLKARRSSNNALRTTSR